MGLREQVREGSFREVAFTTLSTNTGGLARRVEVHQFPFRDRPFTEDFGQQARTFTIRCHVPWDRRTALQDACSAAGPGQLIHPIYGAREVVCTSCEIDEGTDHVGLAFFALEFTDAGDARFPESVPNTGGAVEEKAASAREGLQESFVAKWPVSAPQWVNDAAIARIQDLATALDSARALVPGAVNLSEFAAIISDLSDPAALLADPSLLGSTISSTIQQLAGLSTDPFSTFRMLSGFVAEFGSTFATIDTPPGTSRYLEGQRQDALLRLAKGSAVVEAGAVLRDAPLSSYNDAADVRERTVVLFDGELDAAGDSGDDVGLEALQAVRTAVLVDLRERGAALAEVRSITLAMPTPAVVLAYRLYADPDRGEEIVARNRLRHPMFLPAAVPLEVLSA